MTEDDFKEIAYLLRNGWPGQFEADNVVAYSEFLLPYTFDVVKAALHKLAGDGTRFVPSVGQVIATVRGLSEPPRLSWTEVWAMIETAMSRDEIPIGTDVTVARFIEREGLQRLRMTPFYDPDKGDLRVHQLHQRFDEFAETEADRRDRQRALGTSKAAELEHGEARALPATSGVGLPD